MTKKRLSFLIIGLIIICAASYGGQYKGDTPGQKEVLFPFFPDNRFGLINSSGDIIVQPQYECIKDFKDGLAGVKVGSKWGFIGRDGKFQIKPRFQYIMDGFSDKLACVMENYKYGFIDRTGQWKIKPQFDIAYDFSEGIAQVEVDGKVGFINTSGGFVINPGFARMGKFSEGLAPAKKTSLGKWGYIDKKGNIVIVPRYDFANLFSEGLATVEKNGKHGFIDKTGKVVLDFKYDFAGDFSEGLASVEINKKWGYIDHAGKFVIPPCFDSGSNFSEGLAAVGNGSLYGYIDTKGNIVIKPRNFSIAFPFKDGVAFVGLSGKKAMSGYIDKKGNIIKQWSFDPNELMKGCHPPLNPNASYKVEPPADSLPALEVGEDTGIEYPQIIKRVSPEYPKEAVEKNVQGPVSLNLELDIYGRVISARAFKGPELLRTAAEKAIKQWVFAPSIIDGVPRRVKMTVTLNFKI